MERWSLGWWHLWRHVGLVAVAAMVALAPFSSGVARAEDESGGKWLQTFLPADLWSGTHEDAISFGTVRPFTYLQIHGEAENGRFYVFNPKTNGFAYVDAKFVGPSTPPPESYLKGPRVLEEVNRPARAAGTASIWREPIESEQGWVKDAAHNEILVVQDLVEGEDGRPWYRLADSTYVPRDRVRVPPAAQERFGRWIDVSLSAPTIVTAYENGTPVYSALAIHGTPGWETPLGTFVIQRRVANERMRGPGYDVSGVLFTQYFTGVGHSLHYNYWSSNWGYAGSHGCLGMNYDDSLWFWNWATVGTPVVIHW
ncbi:MAG: L,D-transpeptidase [Chloroflexota bacterium]|nr:L,D-transpeptidase [Chloroflexota bacterium]